MSIKGKLNKLIHNFHQYSQTFQTDDLIGYLSWSSFTFQIACFVVQNYIMFSGEMSCKQHAFCGSTGCWFYEYLRFHSFCLAIILQRFWWWNHILSCFFANCPFYWSLPRWYCQWRFSLMMLIYFAIRGAISCWI